MKNINKNWLKENIQESCSIEKLDNNDKRQIISCAKAYQKIFNGAPFYENWTLVSALQQIYEYLNVDTKILVPEYQNQIIGFLVSMTGVPSNQQEFVPYDNTQIRFIEEIGVTKEFRGQQIASEMVRILLMNFLLSEEKYLGYRTNAMRYFAPLGGESFESALRRVKQEDIIKRQRGEKIIIPEFTLTEKQTFINTYLELLKIYPELDMSNSNQLFRNIFGSIDFCQIDGNYTFQEDPSLNGNDRIFPIIDLEKCMVRERRR